MLFIFIFLFFQNQCHGNCGSSECNAGSLLDSVRRKDLPAVSIPLTFIVFSKTFISDSVFHEGVKEMNLFQEWPFVFKPMIIRIDTPQHLLGKYLCAYPSKNATENDKCVDSSVVFNYAWQQRFSKEGYESWREYPGMKCFVFDTYDRHPFFALRSSKNGISCKSRSTATAGAYPQVVLNPRSRWDSRFRILLHELGHSFGLWHTHYNGLSDLDFSTPHSTCPCASSNDHVDDTPLAPNAMISSKHFGLTQNELCDNTKNHYDPCCNQARCCTGSFNGTHCMRVYPYWQPANIMSYVVGTCKGQRLTHGQIALAFCFYRQFFRKQWYKALSDSQILEKERVKPQDYNVQATILPEKYDIYISGGTYVVKFNPYVLRSLAAVKLVPSSHPLFQLPDFVDDQSSHSMKFTSVADDTIEVVVVAERGSHALALKAANGAWSWTKPFTLLHSLCTSSLHGSIGVCRTEEQCNAFGSVEIDRNSPECQSRSHLQRQVCCVRTHNVTLVPAFATEQGVVVDDARALSPDIHLNSQPFAGATIEVSLKSSTNFTITKVTLDKVNDESVRYVLTETPYPSDLHGSLVISLSLPVVEGSFSLQFIVADGVLVNGRKVEEFSSAEFAVYRAPCSSVAWGTKTLIGGACFEKGLPCPQSASGANYVSCLALHNSQCCLGASDAASSPYRDLSAADNSDNDSAELSNIAFIVVGTMSAVCLILILMVAIFLFRRKLNQPADSRNHSHSSSIRVSTRSSRRGPPSRQLSRQMNRIRAHSKPVRPFHPLSI